MKNTKYNSKHRRLELKKETVTHLSADLLKNVVGGTETIEPTHSFPISRCCSPDTALNVV